MASVFDGLGSIVADVFGDMVTHHPAVGEPSDHKWVLRETPEDLLSEIAVAGSNMVLRVPRDAATTVAVQDEISSGGRRFTITARLAPPLQGDDALVTFELQEVTE